MLKDENLLDQYLKNKVEEADFEFQEAYWLKAAKMLDEEDGRKKKPGFWRWLSLLGVLISVGVGAILYSNNHKEKQQTGKEMKQTVANLPAEQTSKSTPAEKSYKTDAPQSTASIPDQQSASQNASMTGSSPTPAVTTNQINTNPSQPDQKQTRRKKNQITATAANINTPADDANTTQTANAQQTATANVSKDAKPGKLKTNKLRNLFGKNKSAKNNQPEQPITATATPVKPDQTVLIKGKNMKPVDTVVFFERQARDESQYNPRYNAALKDYVTERIDSVTVLTFNPVAEPKNVNPKADDAAPVVKDTAAKSKKGVNIFFAGGAHFNKGFKGNNSTSVAWGIAPYLNVGVEKDLSKKLTMAAQIGFTYFNALNVQKKVVHYKYSFGYDSTHLTVNYRKMYQLVLPVSVAYHLNKSHSVWAAIGATYVLNTQGKVNDNGVTKNQLGYQDGINPLDLFSQLGYQFQLNKRIGIQAFWQQGFLNATKQEYFNLSTQNKQTRLSIGLKYSFKRNGE